MHSLTSTTVARPHTYSKEWCGTLVHLTPLWAFTELSQHQLAILNNKSFEFGEIIEEFSLMTTLENTNEKVLDYLICNKLWKGYLAILLFEEMPN